MLSHCISGEVFNGAIAPINRIGACSLKRHNTAGRRHGIQCDETLICFCQFR